MHHLTWENPLTVWHLVTQSEKRFCLKGQRCLNENMYQCKRRKQNICWLVRLMSAHILPCAIWTLQPESCCILLICSPPRPMTLGTAKIVWFRFCLNMCKTAMSTVKENYEYVLTEADHAIRHPELFRHCGGSDTAGSLKKTDIWRIYPSLNHKHLECCCMRNTKHICIPLLREGRQLSSNSCQKEKVVSNWKLNRASVCNRIN